MPDKLQQAIALIKAGDKKQGSELLGEILRESPDVELAWLWMSGVVDDPEERAYCLEQVLALNPGNEVARKGLDRLRSQTPGLALGRDGQRERAPAAEADTESPRAAAQAAANDPALIEYVVREIGRHTSRQDLLYDVCQRTGMSWPQAEAFVQRVEADHGHEIKGRQRPLLVLVALITLVGGVVLFAQNIPYLMQVFQNPLAYALSAPYILWRAVAVIAGVGMVVGSLLGVWHALSPSTAPPLINLAEESRGADRYKSVDDLFEVGVWVGSRRDRRRRRRGTRLF